MVFKVLIKFSYCAYTASRKLPVNWIPEHKDDPHIWIHIMKLFGKMFIKEPVRLEISKCTVIAWHVQNLFKRLSSTIVLARPSNGKFYIVEVFGVFTGTRSENVIRFDQEATKRKFGLRVVTIKYIFGITKMFPQVFFCVNCSEF